MRTAALQTEFRAITEALAAVTKRTNKIQQKLQIKHGGYHKRAMALDESIQQSYADCNHSIIEQDVYGMLSDLESVGMVKRESALRAEVKKLQEMEAKGQKKYGDLLHEKNRLLILKRRKDAPTSN